MKKSLHFYKKKRRRNSKVLEYSRIVIEEYCRTHSKTKKAIILFDLVELSYTMECEPTEEESIELERIISREKNPELLQALEDLNEFLFG